MSTESLLSITTDSSPRSQPVAIPFVADSGASLVAVEVPHDQINQNNGKPVKVFDRRTEFFLTSIFFLVEDKIYCVPEMMFPGAGYLTSSIGTGNGKSEDAPMHLDITISEMDNLMSVLLARQIFSPIKLTMVQWGEALGLSTRWKLDVARNFAIDQITSNFPYNLASKIRLADAYDVEKWLKPAYHIIATRDTPPTEAEVTALGSKRLVALYKIREAYRRPQVQVKQTSMRCSGCNKVWVFEGTLSSLPGRLGCSDCDHTGLEAVEIPQKSYLVMATVGHLIDASEDLKVGSLSQSVACDVSLSLRTQSNEEPDEEPSTEIEHVLEPMKTHTGLDIGMVDAAVTMTAADVSSMDSTLDVKPVVKEEASSGCRHKFECNPKELHDLWSPRMRGKINIYGHRDHM
ncbi:hypothetical protein FRB96_003913 [Tulasnella sp. 330]|nr:hypothetical protein FRB96_003913 [Tulasnella sp. 330]KAG8872861.1 hypothetical protein FRB97_007279 [Tulasnella sp. 331]